MPAPRRAGSEGQGDQPSGGTSGICYCVWSALSSFLLVVLVMPFVFRPFDCLPLCIIIRDTTARVAVAGGRPPCLGTQDVRGKILGQRPC